MDITTIQRLVTKGEGQRLEFKKKVNFPEKIIKEIVAFANSQGGRLLLGIDDDGTISGARNIEGEVFVLEDTIKKLVTPSLSYSTHIIKLNSKKGVAVFEVPEGQNKPYRVKEHINAEHGTAFIRSGEESIKASKEMRQILKRRNNERDERFNYGEKERVLMQMIEENQFVTLEEFANRAEIPKFMASKTLVKLVLANLLDIKPGAGCDQYFIKE
ncbi:helix-turn-helix domain-containing protein [Roseivirga sp. E12]|uniref:AlbA family DNA-binding domain-containing protein n=1 Tax=Roseivirga sp. E12 TaxID=2819237 RepID=UPI001ABC4609|nr:ATP-binding protein [Roseivirga sp. E12]MBO3699663.1 ATP-binding protein [Roseivirga sp. E12]